MKLMADFSKYRKVLMNMELVQWENVNERWAEEFIYLRLPFFSIKKIYEKKK